MPSTFESVLARDGVLVYTNVGRSMMPLLRQGRDLLVIHKKTDKRLRWLDVPLYKRPDGKYIMHRVMWVHSDSYTICGDNQWRLERGVKEEQILGVLTAVQRDGVTIPMYGTKMRIYSYLQFFCYPVRACYCFVRDKFYGLRRRLRRLSK